ncbi:MAG TPA: caspase family protein [Anaerolineales bacterium]|jgi:hypothetical protein
MSGKYALIIGNTDYTDPGLAQLAAPGKDAEDFARVLRDKEIGAFDEVNVLLNQPEYTVRESIDDFFNQKKPDDLLVLYFSGHGVRDELGSLYLAVKNTNRNKLRATGIKSDYIREAMDQSRSRRQVLILDCCNSGAFAQGTKGATGVSIGTASAFEGGYGRIILTASDSTQFAWEGDKVIGETDNSLFTHYLVEGLEGAADSDGDGRITVDELYDYVYDKVKSATPKQTPSKFSSKQQGEIVLRQSMRLEDIKSVPLPAALFDSIENPFADIRLGAVQQLSKLLNGKNLGLALSAREALEGIAKNDDSRQVSNAATQALESVRRAAEPVAPKESEVISPPAAQPLSPIQEPVRETARETAQLEPGGAIQISNSQILIALGWAIAGVIAGLVYNEYSSPPGAAVGGAIGGLITAIVLRNKNSSPNLSMFFWFTLAWAVAAGAGWTISDALTEATGAGIGAAIGALIAMVILIITGNILFNWKSLVWIVLAWAIAAGFGWSITKYYLIDNLSMDYGNSWAIGMAIGWGIAGFVTGGQLIKWTKKE